MYDYIKKIRSSYTHLMGKCGQGSNKGTSKKVDFRNGN